MSIGIRERVGGCLPSQFQKCLNFLDKMLMIWAKVWTCCPEVTPRSPVHDEEFAAYQTCRDGTCNGCRKQYRVRWWYPGTSPQSWIDWPVHSRDYSYSYRRGSFCCPFGLLRTILSNKLSPPPTTKDSLMWATWVCPNGCGFWAVLVIKRVSI